jgi:hypothetical protein
MKSARPAKAPCKARCIRSLTDSTMSTHQPLYIFNRGTNQGFVIISGDNSLPAVLGYTDHGDYDEAQLPPALLDLIKLYAQLSTKATANKLPPRKAATANTAWTDVDPLIQTYWNQSAPYNNLCPYLTGTTTRSITGCVATAACQILYYYRRDLPATLQATTPTYGYGAAPVTTSYPAGTLINWDLLQLGYNGSEPSDIIYPVALLNAAVGAATWLTYGSSTSGQISNVPSTYSSYFNLNSTCLYKGGSQSDWENMLYNELKGRRPILYSGVTTSNSGHAFIVDGYNASSNLYHFNFGWGGVANGYFTVADDGGCNGFCQQQGMVYNIKPKKQNLETQFVMPSKLLYQHNNLFTTTVTNHGTLPYSGIYFFVSDTLMTRFPTASAAASDVTTIEPDQSMTLTATHKPTRSGQFYYYVMDADGNLLAVDSATTVYAAPKLSSADLTLSASGDQETVGSRVYGLVHSTQADASVRITDAADADPFDGAPLCLLYESNDQGATFHRRASQSTNVSIAAGKSASATFSFTGLKADSLYCVKLSSAVTVGQHTNYIQPTTADSIIYFKVKSASLKLSGISNGCAKLSGTWNSSEFNAITQANTTVTSYDLSDVTYINHIPQTANPNTLYYVADDATISGKNIIKGSVCDTLLLTYGYNFHPKADFTAKSATMLHTQTIGTWDGIILPFTATVPEGMLVRRIDALDGDSISQCEHVTTMTAGTPYLFLTSEAANDRFTASNVTVEATCSFSSSDAVCGTFTNIAATADNCIIDPATHYFEPVAEGVILPAFSIYLNNTERVSLTPKGYAATDSAYVSLSEAINHARTVYEQYLSQTSTTAQARLLQTITECEQGFTNHTYTTYAAVSAATTLLNIKVNEYATSAQVPATSGDDYTSNIVNPSFEEGGNGWTLDANASVHVQSDLAYMAVGIDKSHLLYNCQTSDSTGTAISQTVTGLKDGYYRMTALIATDPGNSVTIFAGTKQTNVNAHPYGKYYFTEGVVDSAIVAGGSLKIGTIATTRPYKIDHFTLTYLGDRPGVTDIARPILGAHYQIMNMDGYALAAANNQGQTKTPDTTDNNQTWTFEPAQDNGYYYLKNVGTNSYYMYWPTQPWDNWDMAISSTLPTDLTHAEFAIDDLGDLTHVGLKVKAVGLYMGIDEVKDGAVVWANSGLEKHGQWQLNFLSVDASALTNLISQVRSYETNTLTGYDGLKTELEDAITYYNTTSTATADLVTSIQGITDVWNKVKNALPYVNNTTLSLWISKCQKLIERTAYPGIGVFQAIYNAFGNPSSMTDSEILNASATLGAAVKSYMKSQIGTPDAPADYSCYIQHPWFCNDENTPLSSSDEDIAAAGLSANVLNAEGWSNNSAITDRYSNVSKSDEEKPYYINNRTAYNFWEQYGQYHFAMNQNLTNLPKGFYTVSCDINSPSADVGGQHVYSSNAWQAHGDGPSITVGDSWQTSDNAVNGRYYVPDGNLGIGFWCDINTSLGNNSGSCAITNFQLKYYGNILDLNEAKDYAPVGVSSCEAQLRRTFVADHWSTFCVPFSLSTTDIAKVFGTGTQVANFTGVSLADNGNITLNFSTTDAAIVANAPCLVRLPQTADKYLVPTTTYTASAPQDLSFASTANSASKQVTAIMKGTYSKIAALPTDGTAYIISANKFYQVNSTVSLKPFRAYFVLTTADASSTAKALNVNIDGETTAVLDIDALDTPQTGNIYDLSGRLVRSHATSTDHLPKGIYIMDGKKFVVK